MVEEPPQELVPVKHAARRLRYGLILAIAVALALSFGVAHLSLYRPINGDEAYNLQIAESISTKFCYCTHYIPERVFPVEESTNGISQYVAGLFFALFHSPDAAKVGSTTVAMLALVIALLLLDSWLVLLTAVLFCIWYVFVYVSINFVGEPWAAAFALFGIAALRACDFSKPLRDRRSIRLFVTAIVCFAISMESKLIATAAIVPITFALSYGGAGGLSIGKRTLRAVRVTLAVTAGAALGLLLLIAFSVIHSMRYVDPGVIWQTFSGYVLNMVSQGRGGALPFDLSHVAGIISQLDTPAIFAIFVLAAVVLIVANWAYAPFIAATLTWWLHYGANERHVFISVYLTIILAALEGHQLLRRVAAERNASPRVVGGTLAAIAVPVVMIAWFFHALTFAPGRVRPFAERKYVIQTAEGRYHYSKALVRILRHERFVMTSGWWQFPDLTLREDLEFYDRTSPANADLPRSGMVLLFDKGNTDSPLTSIAGNCGRVIYTEGPIVVCSPRSGVPLNFQPAT